MARVPTIAKEDAKRPNRERDCLVGERTRIVNRIKSTLARLGIRNFKPTLRGPAPAKAGAAERLATVHTPEGVPLPPNTLAELHRDMARSPKLARENFRRSNRARQVCKDSPLEGDGFEPVWVFSCQVVVFGFRRFFVRRCVQVRLACSAGDSPAGVKVRAP